MTITGLLALALLVFIIWLVLQLPYPFNIIVALLIVLSLLGNNFGYVGHPLFRGALLVESAHAESLDAKIDRIRAETKAINDENRIQSQSQQRSNLAIVGAMGQQYANPDTSFTEALQNQILLQELGRGYPLDGNRTVVLPAPNAGYRLGR